MNVVNLNRGLTITVVAVVLGALSYIGSIGCNGDGETTPSEFDKNYRLIFPQTTHVPAIDGLLTVSGSPMVAEDAWNDSFRLDLVDASNIPGAVMHGVADANNIYLYFEIEDSGFEETDVLLLAFNPSSTASDFHLLIIYPCPLSAGGCPSTGDSLPVDIDYYTGSASGNTVAWTGSAASTGVVAKAATAGGTDWTVELKIPRGAPFNFPATDYFGFYANQAETDTFTGSATEYTWPFINPIGTTNIYGDLTKTPDTTVWGNASLSTSIGNGVRISSRDIYTSHGLSSISWNDSNTFYADVHNNTLQSGTLVAAQDVRATFKWANFGLPGYSSFNNIPAPTGNPTAYANIDPTDSEIYSIDWQASVADQPFYRDNPHWCIRVELNSTNPATVFYRQQAQANMDFVTTSSPFIAQAAVDAMGYQLPDGSKLHEFLLEERFYNMEPGLKWTSELKGVEKIKDSVYKLALKPEQKQRVDLSVLPPDVAIPGENLQVQLPIPGNEDPYTVMPVKSGQLVTVIAQGKVNIKIDESRIITANPVGVVLKEQDNKRYLHTQVSKTPSRIGALIGSWDGFKESSFFVGATSTLKVPGGAESLSLTINSVLDEKVESSKEAYKAYVVTSDLKPYHVSANSSLALNHQPSDVVTIGANLPTVIYRGKRKTGKRITIKKKTFEVYESVGAFGYIVKSNNPAKLEMPTRLSPQDGR